MAITIPYINRCKELFEDMLGKLEIDASLELRATEEMIAVDVQSEAHSKELIGYRGETLTAMQTILGMMLSNEVGERVYVMIDVNGYRERRREALTRMAKRAAEEVMLSGQSLSLEPMQAYDRRTVHLVLKSYPEIETESEGQEPDRRIVIKRAQA